MVESKDLPYDPLNLGAKSRAKGVAVCVAAVIVSLALSESVSQMGFSIV
jgi:hypothetical protein